MEFISLKAQTTLKAQTICFAISRIMFGLLVVINVITWYLNSGTM